MEIDNEITVTGLHWSSDLSTISEECAEGQCQVCPGRSCACDCHEEVEP